MYPTFISGYHITSSLGWNSKMINTDLLESEDMIAKSKIDFRSIQCTCTLIKNNVHLVTFASYITSSKTIHHE